MALKFKDDDGETLFELRLGEVPSVEQTNRVIAYCAYAHASGLELDECNRILGRNVPGPSHVFGVDTSEEIILNWSR